MNVVRFNRGQTTGENCWRVAVMETGRTLAHLIVIEDCGVHKVSLPLIESRLFRPVLFKGAAYPVHRACKRMLEAGRRLGITEGARDMLKAGLTEI